MGLDHLLHEKRHFPPQEKLREKAHIKSFDEYEKMYQNSIEDPDVFWLEQAKTLEWFHAPAIGCRYNWGEEVWHKWFEDGSLNISVNCLDRHINCDKVALIWQGEEENKSLSITYKELYTRVCRFANVLKELGVEKGDRVCLYLPMIPELTVAMLACARIGAIHSVVFAGFSAESLSNRIQDANCKLLITSNASNRGGKKIALKEISDEALKNCPTIQNVLVVKNGDFPCNIETSRDLWFHEREKGISDTCEPEKLNAEDPLFILYTSGSTAKPKGVMHTQAGYLLYASLTHKYVFDIQEDDIYWCTADIGWVTGHSYIVYGPLANGCTTLMFEGIPTYPDPGRFWQIVEKYKVSVFYTAPTAIRALISKGESYPASYDLSSLRILGTVGEPINPEAWMWYHENIGKKNCPIVDTWWQTETGGIMITPLPASHTLKPGSASRPFFGVEPAVLRDDGSECNPDEGGSLCIKKPWPGISRTTWGDHDLFINTYFSRFPGNYYTGDSAVIDEEGDYWLLGRIDDVVNVSGHRIGTAEVESALVSHPAVAEAAVVPKPDPIKGQSLFAFVILKEGKTATVEELKKQVREEIGPIAIPGDIQITKALPKTRSGKIMRRILRKIVEKDIENIGDTSTLADPTLIDELIEDSQ